MAAPNKVREILIIDDDQDQLNLLKKLLNSQGHNVTLANNIPEGLSAMKAKIPHLILLDIVLNHESALQFIKEKISNEFFKNIPLIAMSASDNQKLISTVLALGASDFLKKPILSNALMAKVRSILKEFSFTAYRMDQSMPANIEIDAEIDQINEVGCLIDSPVKFQSNRTIDIQSKLFKELDMEYCRFMVLEDFGRTPSGHYKNEVSFVGIQEKSSKKIRSLRRDS